MATPKKKKEDIKKAGRKTKFDQSYIDLAYKFCCLGADDKKLAEFFKVHVDTINNWKHDYPLFFESIRKGKDKFDIDRVEGALIHRALGYTHKEVKTANFEGKITDVREFDKHYAPDTSALIFWLKNRSPKRWRDKQDIEHSGEITQKTKVDLSMLSDSALDELEKASKKQSE